MGQQQREEERGEDLKVWPLRWKLKQQFPGYEVQQHNIIIDALGGVVTGDGHYDARDRREQE